MDNIEFQVLGESLYGSQWKKELTRKLGLSERSRSVDKMANGKMPISQKTESKLKQLIELKVDALKAINHIVATASHTKIKVVPCTEPDNGGYLVFDLVGYLYQVAEYPCHHLSEIGVLIKNVQLESDFHNHLGTIERDFYLNIFKKAAAVALDHQDQSILINKIHQYFDLTDIPDSFWQNQNSQNIIFNIEI
jgi:hypothetical protein